MRATAFFPAVLTLFAFMTVSTPPAKAAIAGANIASREAKSGVTLAYYGGGYGGGYNGGGYGRSYYPRYRYRESYDYRPRRHYDQGYYPRQHRSYYNSQNYNYGYSRGHNNYGNNCDY